MCGRTRQGPEVHDLDAIGPEQFAGHLGRRVRAGVHERAALHGTSQHRSCTIHRGGAARSRWRGTTVVHGHDGRDPARRCDVVRAVHDVDVREPAIGSGPVAARPQRVATPAGIGSRCSDSLAAARKLTTYGYSATSKRRRSAVVRWSTARPTPVRCPCSGPTSMATVMGSMVSRIHATRPRLAHAYLTHRHACHHGVAEPSASRRHHPALMRSTSANATCFHHRDHRPGRSSSRRVPAR